MTADTSRVTLHMVASLDFFIAKPDGSVSWLETADTYDKGVDGEDAEAFMRTLRASGCFVMGSRTYEDALRFGWPYGDVPTYVLTARDLSSDKASVEFYAGDLVRLVDERLKPRFEHIWVVGGAKVAKDFIRSKLVDDLRITIAPIMIGGGTLFVDHIGLEQPLHLKDVMAYKSGFVELWYEIRD